MLKKIMSWMLPYFVYNLVVLLLIILEFLIPNDADIGWLYIYGLYFPYIFLIIYILGFTFGYFIQKRSMTQSVILQLLLAMVAFLNALPILTLHIFTRLEIFYEFALIPASGSSCLFLIGEIFARHEQKKASRQ